jgi:hypothetical protein
MFIQGQPNISSYMKRNKIKGIAAKQLRDFTDSAATSKISSAQKTNNTMDEQDSGNDDDDTDDS